MTTRMLLIALAVAPLSAEAEPRQAAALFEKYQALGRAFDPAMADLYCDTAVIKNVRLYPDGQRRTLELPADKYKELLRSAIPLARQRGDYSTYSDVKYTPEGRGVRITASRYSALKSYTSPVSILVGPCKGGPWAVLEELSESRP